MPSLHGESEIPSPWESPEIHSSVIPLQKKGCPRTRAGSPIWFGESGRSAAETLGLDAFCWDTRADETARQSLDKVIRPADEDPEGCGVCFRMNPSTPSQSNLP